MKHIGDYYSIPHLPIMTNEVILALNIKPDGIDVSSSIEIYPGIKDLKKTERLIKSLKSN